MGLCEEILEAIDHANSRKVCGERGLLYLTPESLQELRHDRESLLNFSPYSLDANDTFAGYDVFVVRGGKDHPNFVVA